MRLLRAKSRPSRVTATGEKKDSPSMCLQKLSDFSESTGLKCSALQARVIFLTDLELGQQLFSSARSRATDCWDGRHPTSPARSRRSARRTARLADQRHRIQAAPHANLVDRIADHHERRRHWWSRRGRRGWSYGQDAVPREHQLTEHPACEHGLKLSSLTKSANYVLARLNEKRDRVLLILLITTGQARMQGESPRCVKIALVTWGPVLGVRVWSVAIPPALQQVEERKTADRRPLVRGITIRAATEAERSDDRGLGALLHHPPHFVVNVAAFDAGEMLDAVGAVDFIDRIVLEGPFLFQIAYHVHAGEVDRIHSGEVSAFVGATAQIQFGKGGHWG